MSLGIGCREEMVVARKWLSRGIGCREVLVVARNGCRQELVVARNWLSPGIGCRKELVVARNWLPHFLASYDTQGGVGEQILTRVPSGIAGIGTHKRC